MYAFVADQVFGLNGLVNFSNIVFLAAYSVRTVLTLRILAIVGEGMTLPSSLSLRTTGRRVAFSSIDKREFLRLVNLAQWLDCSPGEVILKKGQQVSQAVVLVSGEVKAVLGNQTRMVLRPGQLIGDVSAYSGLVSPVDVVACGPAALVNWELQHLREFTASRPDLRANFLRIVSADLAAKLRDLMVSCFSGEGIAAEPRGTAPGLATLDMEDLVGGAIVQARADTLPALPVVGVSPNRGP
jgi:CRP-like cAMP-binding protein